MKKIMIEKIKWKTKLLMMQKIVMNMLKKIKTNKESKVKNKNKDIK